MRYCGIVLFLALTQVAVSAKSSELLERLRAHVSVDLMAGIPASQLTGHYSSNSKEIGRSALHGNDLYLFPDGSYLYCEWGDLETVTIRDKGKWGFSDGTVTLSSDPDITWDSGAERDYLVVHRKSKPKEVLLVGTHRALSYFEERAGDDPDFTLLLIAKKRVSLINPKAAPKLKADLMRQGWKPDYFRSQEK